MVAFATSKELNIEEDGENLNRQSCKEADISGRLPDDIESCLRTYSRGS